MPVPHSTIRFPKANQVDTQVHQLRAAGQSRPDIPVQPNSTGIPGSVHSVSVTSQGAGLAARSLRISFKVDPSDPKYQSSNVYIKQAGQPPVLVGSGPTAPLHVTVPRGSAPVTVIVQPVGPSGAAPLNTCPSRTVSAT